MTIKIFGETNKPDTDIYLRLVADENFGTVLQAVNKEGHAFHAGNILSIKQDGTLHRIRSCKAPGIKIDSNGKIKETT